MWLLFKHLQLFSPKDYIKGIIATFKYSLFNYVKLYKPLQIWRMIPENVAMYCLGARMYSFEQFACSCSWECAWDWVQPALNQPSLPWGCIHSRLAFSSSCKGTPHSPNCVLIWWGHSCLIRSKASWRPIEALIGIFRVITIGVFACSSDAAFWKQQSSAVETNL